MDIKEVTVFTKMKKEGIFKKITIFTIKKCENIHPVYGAWI